MAPTLSYETITIDPFAAATTLVLNSILTITDISVISVVQRPKGVKEVTICITEDTGAQVNTLVIHPIKVGTNIAAVTDITLRDNVTFHGAATVNCVVDGEDVITVLLAAVVDTGTLDLKYSTEKLSIVPGTPVTAGPVTTAIAVVHNETIPTTYTPTFKTGDVNGETEATMILLTLAA